MLYAQCECMFVVFFLQNKLKRQINIKLGFCDTWKNNGLSYQMADNSLPWTQLFWTSQKPHLIVTLEGSSTVITSCFTFSLVHKMESKNKFATQNFVKGCHTLEQKNGPDFSLTSHGSKKSCPVAQNRWIFLLDKSFKFTFIPKRQESNQIIL